MRNISVSTAVYAAIWAKRQVGEESENEILARLLGTDADQVTWSTDQLSREEAPSIRPSGGGYSDERYGVHFVEGQEIFRTYKGKEYRAKASKGYWNLQNDGRLYPSLHKLSWSVVGGHENAWNNWNYRLPDGRSEKIGNLRNPNTIQQRGRGILTDVDVSDL